MSADKFNDSQVLKGELSCDDITRISDFWNEHHDSKITYLVEFWQKRHRLEVDGYAGENTIHSIRQANELIKNWPLLLLPDGRKPHITSKFYTENDGRSTHKGVDMFYEWLESDPDVKLGDGGAIKKRGKRRWWYPDGAVAVAAAAGQVSHASKIGTGYRVWVDHGNGERTGYFHGSELLCELGQVVEAGAELMGVGDNPKGYDAKHLHFEVSPVDRYAPMNPRTWLRGARYVG